MQSIPTVSVVIPVFNGSRTIGETVGAVLGQTRAAKEIIVVDDGSTDDTAAVVAAAGGDRVKIVVQANAGPAAARNAGVAVCTSDYVAFTDSDCLPTPTWLEEMVAGFTGGTIAAVGGTVRGTGPGLISRYADETKMLEPSLDPVTGRIYSVVTANACFRRDVLNQVGGFSPRFRRPGGEEPELCLRIREAGYELRALPNALVYHHHKQTMRVLLKTLANYGEGRWVLTTIRPGMPWREAGAWGLVSKSLQLKDLLGQIRLRRKSHGLATATAFAMLRHAGFVATMWGYLRARRRDRG